MKLISDFGMRISDFVFGDRLCPAPRTHENSFKLPNTKSEIRIPKSEIES